MRDSSGLPSALDHFHEIELRLAASEVGVFLDYDGTLTPIVDRPELAVLSSGMRALLAEVGALCTVAIVSGRAVGELMDLVRVDALYYAGSHGFEIVGPKGSGIRYECGAEFVPALESAHADLSARLRAVDGVIIENKKYSLSVHYRLVRESSVRAIDQALDEVLGKYPALRRTAGKKVFEVRPRLDWHKGEAVRSILRMLGFDAAAAVALYVGDDTTDEDAFEAIAGTGIGVLVADEPRRTAATYRLQDPDGVRAFLERLTAFLPRRRMDSRRP